jgi:hypothetical protein
MAPTTNTPTREALLHMLYEAAELEHNLMCTYLYAAFSLKDEQDGLQSDEALAGGVVLQVDQAAFADQGALWRQRERGQDADLDCHIHLLADCYCEKTVASRASQPVRNSTNLELVHV